MNFPVKSNGKNIVSAQRRCSIIYSSLQLLLYCDTSAPLRAGPKTLARQFGWLPRAAIPAAITTIYELSEILDAGKSVNIPAIRAGGMPNSICGDARDSHLSFDVSGWLQLFLIMHFFHLFSGGSGIHFALKAVDEFFFSSIVLQS